MRNIRGIPYIILAILLLLPFHRVFLYGEFLTGTDASIPLVEPFASEFKDAGNKPWEFALRQDGFLQTLPSKQFTQGQLIQGKMPLWNPWIFCGTPHQADMYSQVFAVTDTPFLYFMSLDTALTVATILKILLLGFGMYFVARRLGIRWELACISSLVICFSFQSTQWLEVPAFLSTLLYLPWMFLAWDKYLRTRRFHWVMLTGILGGLSILGGQGQIFATIWLILLLYTIFGSEYPLKERKLRSIGSLFVSFSAAILIGWVQIYPAMEFVALSKSQYPEAPILSHFGNETLNFFPGGFRQIGVNLLRLFAPFRYGEPDQWYYKNHKELIIYLGFLAPAVIWALWRSKRERFQNYLWWLCTFSMAVIVFNTVFEIVLGIIPFMQFQNLRRVAALLFNFHIALLIPYAIEILISKRDEELVSRLKRICLFTGYILVIYFVYVGLRGGKFIGDNIYVLGYYLVAICALLLYKWLLIDRNIKKAYIYLIVMLIFFLEIWNYSGHLILTSRISSDDLREPAVLSRMLPVWDYDSNRIYRSSPDIEYGGIYLNPNTGALVNIYDAQGYNPLNIAKYRYMMESVTKCGKGANPRMIPNFNDSDQYFRCPLPRILNIDKVMAGEIYKGRLDPDDPKRPYFPLFTTSLSDNFSPPPAWAYIFYNYDGISELDFISGLRTGKLDLSQTAYIINPDVEATSSAPEQPISPLVIDDSKIEKSPGYNRISDIELEKPGVLVFSENNYPGWKATVDGDPREVLTVNGTLRGVYLDKGTHSVVFTFDPPRYRTGLVLSIVSIAVIFILFVVLGLSCKKREERNQKQL